MKEFDVVFRVTGRFRVRATASTVNDAIKAASQAAQNADLRKLTDIRWELVNWTIKDKEEEK